MKGDLLAPVIKLCNLLPSSCQRLSVLSWAHTSAGQAPEVGVSEEKPRYCCKKLNSGRAGWYRGRVAHAPGSHSRGVVALGDQEPLPMVQV